MRHLVTLDYADLTHMPAGTHGRLSTRVILGIDDFWVTCPVISDGTDYVEIDPDRCEVEAVYDNTPEPDGALRERIIEAALERLMPNVDWS